MKKIVLASTSPRREALLRQIGLDFTIESSGFEDELPSSGDPDQVAISLALAKARAVATRQMQAIVIGADTLVVLEGALLGKPRTTDEARSMLHRIAGKSHTVVTGLAIVEGTRSLARSAHTRVQIKSLTDAEVEGYLRSGEPLGKAGAYAIQGLGAAIVERIEGDYSNVVGLPLYSLVEVLKDFGVYVL